MIKDAYYFPHDSNARFDPKILKMRAKFGLEGYGFYFCVLEIMRDNSDYMLDKDELDVISFQLQIEESKAKAMLDFCLNIGLFYEKNNKIFSDSFLLRMNEMDELRAKRAEAGRKGGKAKAKLKQNCGNEQALKESKEKESKVNKNIDIYTDNNINNFIKLLKENNYRFIDTKQNRELISIAILNEPSFKLWDEVIKKSLNKGHFIDDRFMPLSLERMLENYSKILEDSYGLTTINEQKTKNEVKDLWTQ